MNLLSRAASATCLLALGLVGLAGSCAASTAWPDSGGQPRTERLVPVEAEALAFFVGEWDVEVFGPDGELAYRAETRARPILDGHALQDDWRALDALGNVMFRGTSLRCYMPSTGRWVIHWVMADVPGYTYLEADWIDGELRASGHGVDPNGSFLERLRYFEITGDRYRLLLERSYDGGRSYQPYTHLVASKRGL